jgi:broad specificity phosphatase PhoE
MAIVAKALSVPLGEVTITQALNELNPGEADALSWDAYRKRFSAPDWDLDPSVPLSPGGESWSGFVDRAAEALEDLVASHPGGLVLAATHAGVIEASLLRFLVGSPFGAAHPRLRLRTAYGSLSEWEHGDGRWQLRSYNLVPSGL